jgi:hypothetical protein
MTSPQESLRALIEEPFSSDLLSRIEATLARLALAAPASRVGCFVVRKVCIELNGFMEATEPTTPPKHDAIEAHILPPIRAILSCLETGVGPSWEALADLIAESLHVRTRLQASHIPSSTTRQ